MVSRRQFVGLSLFVIAHPTLLRWRAPRVLRVGTIVDSARTELARGLTFGAAEAARTAAMFGWSVETAALSPDHVAGRFDRVDAIVVAAPVTVSDARPTLHCVDAPPTDLRTLTLLPRASTRTRAIAGLPDSLVHNGDYRVELWHPSLERFGARQLNDRYRAGTHSDMTSDAWLGWLSMKILSESAIRAAANAPEALNAYLHAPTTQFDGHKGSPLWFDRTGELQQPLYIVRRESRTSRWVVDREIMPPERTP
jgi:hypothetical protein